MNDLRHWQLGLITPARLLKQRRDTLVVEALTNKEEWTRKRALEYLAPLCDEILGEIMEEKDAQIKIDELRQEISTLQDVVYSAISHVNATQERLHREIRLSHDLADILIQRLGPELLPSLMTGSDSDIRNLIVARYKAYKDERKIE